METLVEIVNPRQVSRALLAQFTPMHVVLQMNISQAYEAGPSSKLRGTDDNTMQKSRYIL